MTFKLSAIRDFCTSSLVRLFCVNLCVLTFYGVFDFFVSQFFTDSITLRSLSYYLGLLVGVPCCFIVLRIEWLRNFIRAGRR